jgi:hypothetical protein
MSQEKVDLTRQAYAAFNSHDWDTFVTLGHRPVLARHQVANRKDRLVAELLDRGGGPRSRGGVGVAR